MKGERLAFVNNEEKDIDHNVFSLSKAGKFDIGLAQRGSVEEVDFPNVGEVKYYCSIHKNMEGVAIIVPAPHFVRANQSGQFNIKNVPPGPWLIKTFVAHRRYASQPMPITLSDASLSGEIVQVTKKTRRK